MRAILAFLLMTASAFGSDGICRERYSPPPEFTHDPEVNITVIYWPDDWMQEFCLRTYWKWAPAGYLRGCTYPSDDGSRWFIYINAVLDSTQQACVYRHEIAHINGWRHGPVWAGVQGPDGQWHRVMGPQYRRPIHYKRRYETGYPNN